MRPSQVIATHEGAPRPPASDPWDDRRKRFLAALLTGDSVEAVNIARTVSGPDVLEGLYLHVIQPAMYAIGERWESGIISIAQEHLASGIASRAVAELSATRTTTKPWRGRALVTAAPNEYHQLGAWMVTDLLEMDGWAVSYLGANTPARDVLTMSRSLKPTFLAVSVAMPFNLDRARMLIAAMKSDGASCLVPCMVGGRAFNLHPDTWKAVGADAWAEDAVAAVALARQFGRRGERP